MFTSGEPVAEQAVWTEMVLQATVAVAGITTTQSPWPQVTQCWLQWVAQAAAGIAVLVTAAAQLVQDTQYLSTENI
jgi:hypothetical protein